MIQLLIETPDWIAVNKPEGISIHNNEDETNLIKTLAAQLGNHELFPVHRLDKDTSGVQLFTRTSATARRMATAFEKRQVSKIYTGILRGRLDSPQGVWNNAITDRAEGRRNPQGLSTDRKLAETRFKVLNQTQYFTLCEFNLITGLQHQIRKHCALARHAIVGDPRYGDKEYNRQMANLYKNSRMFLHCSSLKIFDVSISSPLPTNFSSPMAISKSPLTVESDNEQEVK